MKRFVLAALTVAGCSAALAAQIPVEYPSGARDQRDPRLVAFYQARCTEFAAANGTATKDRDGYVGWCADQMAQVMPVGTVEPSGSE